MSQSSSLQKATMGGVLVSMGIVFGDIGTSPLYTLSAVMGKQVITESLVLGVLSAIIWTLTFQTTLKYVLITLRADNKGEGGIFSLYALVRRLSPKLVLPAILGGAFLLADGMITPPITVSSAVEGLQIYYPTLNTQLIVIFILVLLFVIQQFGTERVGKLFGPVMLLWFGFIGVIGLFAISTNYHVLAALNPYYALDLLIAKPQGFWLLGGVFLCTTGAEALYSDLGHCGRNNIRVSWIFVKITLILSYAGQSSWLLNHINSPLPEGARPFFAIVPPELLVFSICLATAAAIIASQALISGSYTLINEAMQLNLWIRTRVVFPSDLRGQLYIPRVNWALMIGCLGVVLYFGRSEAMEGAYGLAVSLTMLMTTILISFYLVRINVNKILVGLLTITFLTIEISFLIANSAKFSHGGYVSVGIGLFLALTMYIIYRAKQIRSRLTEAVPLPVFSPTLKKLSQDSSIPKYATHLVYLTSTGTPKEVEQLAIDSILRRSPKRADVYWFVNVNVVDEPYKMSYKVFQLEQDDVVFVRFNLGFRVEPKLNSMFRQVVSEMVAKHEINVVSRYDSLARLNQTGDFKFVIFKRFLSNDNELPWNEKLILDTYFLINKLSVSNQDYFGLDTSNVTVENVPLILSAPPRYEIAREEDTDWHLEPENE